MMTRLLTLILLITATSLPFHQAEAVTTQEREEITDLWYSIDLYSSSKNATVTALLDKHEVALEVLLDILYGVKNAPVRKEVSVDELVKKLGAESFKERNAAHKELAGMSSDALSQLEKYKGHDDPEISMRIQEIIVIITPKKRKKTDFYQLERKAANLLGMHWPTSEMRKVTNRNFKRLAKATLLPPESSSWKTSIMVPLLASLRYSENKEDRERLNTFLNITEGKKKLLTIKLMYRYGLSRFGIQYDRRLWGSPPVHDYGEAILEQLDVKNPVVFKQAMTSANHDKDLRLKLLASLKLIDDQSFKDDVIKFLWKYLHDSTALKMIAEGLESPDFTVFAKTLDTMIGRYNYQGVLTIPILRPFLKGDDVQRKKKVLIEMGNNRGSEGIKLAVREISPFMLSKDDELRNAARNSLLKMQGRSGLNILKKMGESNENATIRSEAKLMYNKWREDIHKDGHYYKNYPWPDIVDKNDRLERDASRVERAGAVKFSLKKLESNDQNTIAEAKKELRAFLFRDIPILKKQKPSFLPTTREEIDKVVVEIRSRYWEKNIAQKPVDDLLKEVKSYLDNAGFRELAVDINANGFCRMKLSDEDITDLSSLEYIPFYDLTISSTQVSDLSPLKGMPLEKLWLLRLHVKDLSPLKGMPLKNLTLTGSLVEDLSPLQGMSLTDLDLSDCYNVTDIAPLRGMPLTRLNLNHTKVSDISPLGECKLMTLYMLGTAVKDLSPIASQPMRYLTFDPETVVSGYYKVVDMPNMSYLNSIHPSRFWTHHKKQGHPYFINSVGKSCVWNKEMEYRLRLRNTTSKPITINGKWNQLTDEKSFIKPAKMTERTIKPGDEEDVVFKCCFVDGLKEKPTFSWSVKDDDKLYTGDKSIVIIRNGYYVEGAKTAVPEEALFKFGKHSWMSESYENTWTGPNDCSATAVLRKEKDGLRVQVKVVDEKLVAERTLLLLNDAVGMHFDFRSDERRDADIKGTGPFTIVVVPPVGTIVPGMHRVNAVHNRKQVKDLVIKSKVVENGYLVEVFLPYSGFTGYHGKPGETFYFDLAVCDNDVEGSKSTQKLRWSGKKANVQNIQNWGMVRKAPAIKDKSKNAFSFSID